MLTGNNKISQEIAAILENSNVLAKRFLNNPSWFHEFIQDKNWHRNLDASNFKEDLLQEIEKSLPSKITDWQRLYRHFKYKKMIRIVARDIAAKTSVQETLREWSSLADVIIDSTYKTAFDICKNRYGEPMEITPEGERRPVTGVIIGIGKLGSSELNLSSDIDILCIYSEDAGETTGGELGKLSNHEFYTKVVTIFTKILSDVTSDGFVFRVDHDLRPEGRSGPLVNSIEAIERYYEIFGQDWERQALLRARVVAGDISLGKDFINYISPFIYRRSLSLSDLSHLKKMKEKIGSNSSDNGFEEDVKLGKGGIRELEFFVQAFQQVFGGKFKDVRSTNTFQAIEALKKNHLIHKTSAGMLSEAYSFMRKLENTLQLTEEQQTHKIPRHENELAKLAKIMNFNDSKELLKKWIEHSQTVHRLFNALFEENYEQLELTEAIEANMATCKTEEEKADSLSWFKNIESRYLVSLDLDGKIELPDLLRRLTIISEVVIKKAWGLANESLQKRFGNPMQDDGSPAQYAVIGFGRLGSMEIDYGSDLDLCFLYSDNGKTKGPQKISNQEYFTRLSQRIISLISLNTRYGYAYKIDSDLRPSGRQGSLVATLDSFSDYYLNKCRLWEREALLKARVITGDTGFTEKAALIIEDAAFKRPVPNADLIVKETRKMREKIETEMKVVTEKNFYDLKSGYGGIWEIESIIHFLQLTNLEKSRTLWSQNGFKVLKALCDLTVISEREFEDINSGYTFNRLVMARSRLLSKSSSSVINFNHPLTKTVAQSLKYDLGEFESKLNNTNKKAHKIFMGL